MSRVSRHATSIVLAFILLALTACTASGFRPDRGGSTSVPDADFDMSIQKAVECSARQGQSSGDGWTWTAYVSAGAGLVVSDLRFGPRMVARSLSVPSIALASGISEQKTLDRVSGSVGHLTLLPRTTDTDLTSTLLGEPECNPGRHAGVLARYKVTSAKLHREFIVEQDYRFDSFNPDTRCEAGKTAQCVRFWPSVYWASVNPPEHSDHVGLDITQRYEFDPDGTGGGSADLTSDTGNTVLRKIIRGEGIAHHSDDGMLTHPGSTQALSKGKVLEWENWHQTSRMMVTLPGLPKYMPNPSPVTLHGYAGCPECVHFHWSWFGRLPARAAEVFGCGSPLCWTNGAAQILPGSRQTACLGYRSENATLPGDTDWCTQPRDSPDEQLPPDRRINVYWESRSTGVTSPAGGVNIAGTQYAHGDGLWPQRPNGNKTNTTYPGDTGAMFFVPARGLDSVGRDTKPDHAQVALEYEDGYPTDGGGRLPAGWVVPIALTLKEGNQGPFYLRVRTSTRVKWLQAPDNPVPTTNPGGPWVNLYDDADPRADPNAISARLTVSDGKTRYAYVVLDREPVAGDLDVKLDAAPDKVEDYKVSTGLPTKDVFGEPDWQKALYEDAGCPEYSDPKYRHMDWSPYEPDVDVNADGVADRVIQTGCSKEVHTNPDGVFVYDGTTTFNHARPTLLGSMGYEPETSYLGRINFTVDSGVFRLKGPALSDHGSTGMGADQTLTIRYRWVRNRFVELDRAAKPLPNADPTDPPASPLAAFVSPTGNLVCGQLEDGLTVACFADENTLGAKCADESPAAMSTVGPSGDGAFSGCGQGERQSIPKGDELGYGKWATLSGGVTCEMESTGVTCTNPQGHGFILSRDSHKEF